MVWIKLKKRFPSGLNLNIFYFYGIGFTSYITKVNSMEIMVVLETLEIELLYYGFLQFC
jgi:hypothetical protein